MSRISEGNLSKAKITGGSIKASTVQEMIKASYNDNKGYDTIGEYNKDKSLSNNEVLCYYTLPPRTDPQAVAVFRGTEGTLTDWSNNAKYAVGAYETTDRLKRATDAFNRIIAKYGRANTSLIGHSQSAVITRKLGQGAKEVINLNGANLGEKSLDNEYNVRSSTDVISAVKPVTDIIHKVEDKNMNAVKGAVNVLLPKKYKFDMAKDTSKQNTTIAGGYNPVVEHMPGIIDRIDPNKLIGAGIMGRGFDTSIITSGQVIRTPLSEKIMETINQSTAGMLRERLKTTSYDKLYHLRIDFSTADGVITIEKNYGSIDTLHNDTRDLTSESEKMDIGPVPKGLTVGQVLDNTRKAMGSSYSSYNGLTNNCQDFIISILSANRLGNSRVNSFVKQNLYELIEPELKMVAKEGAKQAIHEGLKTEQGQQLKQQAEDYINKNMDTEQGQQARELIKSHLQSIQGGAIGEHEVLQSVIFKRPEWTLKKAVNWLKKHKYKHIVDVKPEHYRFRQHDPRELEHKGYHYITKKLGKHIDFIIGMLNERNKSAETKDNKGIINKIKNITMPYRKHQAESESDSDSESDDEMHGMGLRNEEDIIRKIDKLADRIQEHHHLHGGKIHIAKAFKDMGSKIKKGFTDDVKAVKSDAQAVGKYVTSKNGLADDLTNYAIPATLGAIGGVAGEIVGGPAGGVAGSMLGTYAGDKLAGQVDKSGHMDTRGDKMKAIGGSLRGRGMYDNLTMEDMHKIKAMNKEMELRESHHKRNVKTIAKAEEARRKREMKQAIKDAKEEAKRAKVHGRGLIDEPLMSQLQASPALQAEIKRKRGRPAGSGFSPTKMVNRGIMLSKKGGPVGGLARGAYLDAQGKGVMDLIKPKDKYSGDVYLGNARQSGAYQAGMGQGNADRLAVSGVMATAKKIRGRGRPKKIQDGGDLVHIDIGSHNESVKGGLIRKDMSATVMPPDAISQDAIRPIGMPKPRGLGFKKGSQEAKDHMARIRALKKK